MIKPDIIILHAITVSIITQNYHVISIVHLIIPYKSDKIKITVNFPELSAFQVV